MAEPNLPVILSAGILALTGIEPQPIFWALLGATVGLSLAPATTRLRAAIVFIAVVLLSALGGTFLTSVAFSVQAAFVPLTRNAFSAIIAMLFHPLLTAFVNSIPAVVKWAVSRLPGSKS